MTRESGLASPRAEAVGAGDASTIGAGASAAAGGASPFGVPPPDEVRRRLRRRELDARSLEGACRAGAGAETGAGSEAVERRRRRRREGLAAAGGSPAAALLERKMLAPTSPSAQSAPSAVWTSTRHTATAVRALPTGARFWVSVQRA